MQADLRGKSAIKNKLEREKKAFDKLSQKEKPYFDLERLTNPYSDTRLLHGDPDKQVKKILTGIDISVSELLLANQLKNIDLVISHHPSGIALARLDDVMELQIDLLADLGIPVNIAEDLLEKRMSEVFRSISPENHYRVVDTAKLLNIPLICSHTACDNRVAKFLKIKIDKAKPEIVQDVVDLLQEIPEYKMAKKLGTGPTIFAGKPERRVGEIILIEVTGGTSGSKNIYQWLAQAGVGTIVGMHMSEEYKKEAEKWHINVVIAGHMASDSLGMNLFLDELEKKGIEVIPCSGLTRIRRK
jgi:putative NIF3 family GTP cyclohydrolase 1 type 2